MPSTSTPDVQWHSAVAADLALNDMYKFLKLRVDVFVVEQRCPYAELDFRDLEPATVHFWASVGDEIVSYLRVMEDPENVARIGRVCTAHHARSHGVARVLMENALQQVGERVVELSAQSHLAPWYETFGFEVCGTQYIELGIAHVPMRKIGAQ